MHFKILLLCITTISAAPLQLNLLQTLKSFQDKTLQDSVPDLAIVAKNDSLQGPIQTNVQETENQDENVVKASNNEISEDSTAKSRKMKQMLYQSYLQNRPVSFWPEYPMSQNQVQHQMFSPQHVMTNEESEMQLMNQDMKNQMLPVNPLMSQMPLAQPNQEMFLNQDHQDPMIHHEMLNPLQEMSLINQITIQQQLLELYRLQALQNLNAMNMLHQPPLLVFLPTDPKKNTEELVYDAPSRIDVTPNNSEVTDDNKSDANKTTDPESIVIEAADLDKDKIDTMNAFPNTMLILPNGRFSIGEIITGISWLPIEINVPDSIAWAYNGISNGISGIWSVIGQWPFRRPTPVVQMKMNPLMNMYMRTMTMRKQKLPLMMRLPNNVHFLELPLLVP